jgi:hypothetical protein
MRRNFSRGKNSARRAPEQISSDPREMFPQNSQLPDLAMVQDRCKELWAQITAKIVAIRDDFEKFCLGKSSAARNRTNEDLASWRGRMTFMARVGNLMRSAQRGFRSVCAATIQSEVRSESSWEITKRQFDPKFRAEMEKYVSRMLDHRESPASSEFEKRLDDKEGSDGDQRGQADVHPDVSRTRATVERTIRFWADEIAKIESIVSNVDKGHTETNSLEHLSDGKILSSFRNRTTMMKQTIRMLSQAQEGLLSGFTAVGLLAAKLETTSSGTMKAEHDKLVREWEEKIYCVMAERSRIYGFSIPEIHDMGDENSKTP